MRNTKTSPSHSGALDWITEPMQLSYGTDTTLSAKTTGFQSTDVEDATAAGILHLLATPVSVVQILAGVG